MQRVNIGLGIGGIGIGIGDGRPDVYTLHTMNGLTAEFSVEAADASGVYRVVVVYTDGQATWQSLDLAYNGTSGMWEGDLDLYQSIQYHVQAVDNTGNVGFLTKDGSDEDDSGGIYGSTFSAARIFQAILVDNDVDYDGLPNSEEATESTDPQNPDSDGDGDNDGSEAHNGRDPLDPADGERITITTALVNGGEDVQIEWPSALGNNGAIDGPYWIYRSTDVSFDAAEILVTTPYPIPDGTETWTDSGTGSAPETYYYKVLNARYLDPAPVVNVVFPNDGPETGGTSVTIYGEHFSEGDTVTFGFAPAAAVVVVSDLAITCETPAGAGTAKVIVTRRNGQFGEKIGGFTYTP